MKLTAKAYRGGAYRFAHYKLDGHQIQLIDGRFWTTHPHEVDLSWMDIPIYPGIDLAGELWVPGHPASAIKTALKERWSELRWSVFAVMTYGMGADLRDVEARCAQLGYDFIPYIVHPDIPKLIEAPLPKNTEGYVFKDGNILNWVKWKPVKTIDLVVVDIKEGKGKYEFMTGALVCATAEGYVVASVGGMTDEERDAMDEDCIGRVVEVAYQYVGSQGRLRHPRFVQFRDDKLSTECTVDQDYDLQAIWNAKV